MDKSLDCMILYFQCTNRGWVFVPFGFLREGMRVLKHRNYISKGPME